MKNCSDCSFCIRQDFGYSNYTVEGTDFYCAINKHPDDGFDRFYNEDPRLNYAEECDSYEPGDGFDIDVDGDWKSYVDSDYQEPYRSIIKKWAGI